MDVATDPILPQRANAAHTLGTDAWPADGLESVSACPVCGSRQRRTLYQRLVDRVFRCAPGEWTLYRCDECEAAYLDPRPTAATIELAYRDYYTHGIPGQDESLAPRSWTRRLRNALRNGYLNSRLGYTVRPGAPRLATALALLIPGARARAHRFVRSVPSRPNDTLLDVGCGNGWFLHRMTWAGWQASGIDPDASAVAMAKAAGLDAQIGVLGEDTFPPGKFGVITLNHVMEHLPDPVAVLRHCFGLLRPGGLLWIATPNLDSRGHHIFGRDWLALDPPRHLVIFNRSALEAAVVQAGFEILSDPPLLPQAVREHAFSARLAAGAHPFDPAAPVPLLTRVSALLTDLLLPWRPNSGEEIVLIARRPA